MLECRPETSLKKALSSKHSSVKQQYKRQTKLSKINKTIPCISVAANGRPGRGEDFGLKITKIKL